MEERTSVLVVGGALTGLSSALFLNWHGVRCLLVERHPTCSSTRGCVASTRGRWSCTDRSALVRTEILASDDYDGRRWTFGTGYAAQAGETLADYPEARVAGLFRQAVGLADLDVTLLAQIPGTTLKVARLRDTVRRVLVTAAVVTLLLAATVTGLAVTMWRAAKLDTSGTVAFRTPLPIPPLADSRVDAQGRRTFHLTAREGISEFTPGVPTATWGFNGAYLGPTLRARRGETVRVTVRNALPEPTTVHWHGMHLPARMDGGPHQLIPPGDTWAASWRVDQPAATLWYHPHPHGVSERHIYRGLAGLFLVDDPTAATLPLPRMYGVDDVPVIVQDKKVTDDGALDDSHALIDPTGLLGDRILVNGALGPYLRVTTDRVRLRLLNASTARVYSFGFADDRPFHVIGSDGGLLARPHATRRVQLSPGERADIVVTARPGERAVVRSYPPRLGTDWFDRRFGGGDDTWTCSSCVPPPCCDRPECCPPG